MGICFNLILSHEIKNEMPIFTCLGSWMSTNQEQSVNQAANKVLLKLELCLALKIHLDEEYFFEEV